MGMSASQARLLSLQARMSDVEYEGQQINQQRLVLSNKMNEVMEKMTNMDVPTPPSKQDFLYNVYKGKTRNGKTINATMNDDGTFNITKEVEGLIVKDAGLQNITHGSSITGTKLTESAYINGSTGKYRDAQDGETPTEYRSATSVSSNDFKAYDTNNYQCVYTPANPLSFEPSDQPYTQNHAQGTSYGKDLKITVPKYKISETTINGGLYERDQGLYFGNAATIANDAPVKYQFGQEQLTEAEVKERNEIITAQYNAQQKDSNGLAHQNDPLENYLLTIDDSKKCKAYQLFDKYSGKPLTGQYYYSSPYDNISNRLLHKNPSSSYRLVSDGTRDITLTGLYTQEQYNAKLSSLQGEIDDMFNNVTFKENSNIIVQGLTADIAKNNILCY